MYFRRSVHMTQKSLDASTLNLRSFKYYLALYCIQKETDAETENNTYYDFTRFGDSSTVRSLLKQQIAIIRANLDTI